MVRKKTYSRIAGSCLVCSLLLFPLALRAETFKMGKITQVSGDITFLNFAAPYKVGPVTTEQQLLTDGSYLTQDSAFMTVKLFDGSWIRVSPKSKFAIEFEPDAKTILVHLFTGSLKILFSSHLNDNQVQKIIVKTADTLFETVDAKFSVVRSPLTDMNSVYVEKGTVVAIQNVLKARIDVQLVHSREMVSVKDDEKTIRFPTKMSDKEMKFLHSSQYLKQTKAGL